VTKVCIFPGQGTQEVGMGAALFARYPQIEAEASDILGWSLRLLCLEDPHGQLGQTQFTQPAIYSVNALSYRQHIEDGGAVPDYAAGHSLGEYNALQAAGAFDFATGLRLVLARGEIMAQVGDGGMLAVIGLYPWQVREVLEQSGLAAVQIANFNSYEQIVLAGPHEALGRAAAAFTAAGARHTLRLRVNAPFHSSAMAEAARRFTDVLAGVQFRPLRVPVIANATALPYDDAPRNLLARQIDHPVRWIESVEYLLRQGAEVFDEIGVRPVLQAMVRNIRERSAFAAATKAG
jgi:malonyl CoA-acyl carrier protein transacylase